MLQTQLSHNAAAYIHVNNLKRNCFAQKASLSTPATLQLLNELVAHAGYSHLFLVLVQK